MTAADAYGWERTTLRWNDIPIPDLSRAGDEARDRLLVALAKDCAAAARRNATILNARATANPDALDPADPRRAASQLRRINEGLGRGTVEVTIPGGLAGPLRAAAAAAGVSLQAVVLEAVTAHLDATEAATGGAA